MVKKENICVAALLIKYEHRKPTMFKVLEAVIYCILENNVCLDYVFLQKYTKLSSFHKVFEDSSYNDISVIFIPELLMNIVLCHGFVKYKTLAVILTCQRNLASYYLSEIFVIPPKYSEAMKNVLR